MVIRTYFQSGNKNLKDKILSLDFKLIFLVLLLGVISFFAMYSTERGNFSYYTQSHIYRFSIFFLIFITFSFLEINFWHKSAYLFYFIVLILLVGVDFFGIVASGSRRWINLFFFNLQPSELMKIALIVFLAKYYSRISTYDVSNIKFMILPMFAIFIPVALIITQPDLGTAMLIAATGFAVLYIFICCIGLLDTNRYIFFKTLPEIKNINLSKSRKRSFRSRISNYSIQNCSWFRRNIRQRFFKWKSKLFRLFTWKTHRLYIHFIFWRIWFYWIRCIVANLCSNNSQNCCNWALIQK